MGGSAKPVTLGGKFSTLQQYPCCGVKHTSAVLVWEGSRTPEAGGEQWKILRCMNRACDRFILLVIDKHDRQTLYPAGHYELDSEIGIRKEVRDEFAEAGRDLDVGSYLSSMTMSRRVLQRCLKDKGCTKRELKDQIDEALESGILREPFRDLATEIREYGNIGAHPDDDQLENVTPENATSLLDFVRTVIEDIYVMPSKVQRLNQQRVAAKKP